MADFNVTARNGNMINVPDFAKLNIDGIEIIGDQTTDWNEPIQKNFLAVDKKVMNLENRVLTDVPVGAIFTDTVYPKPVSEPISYIVGLQTELDNKLEAHQDISGKADKSELPTKVSDLQNDAGYLNVHLSKSDILGMGFRDTDLDTQLSEAQITAMGFTKDVNTDTVYDDSVLASAVSFNTAKRSYPAVDESKLAGIEANATADQTKTDIDALDINAATVNNKTVLTNVPANALFTDTVYDDTSILDKIELEKSRIDGILYASGADADTFAEIVTLVNSIDTTNDDTLAGYVTANNDRSTAIETSVSNVNSLINYPSATLAALVV